MSRKNNNNQVNHCSFCGRPNTETPAMVAGPDGVYICSDCIDICRHMVDEEGGVSQSPSEVHKRKSRGQTPEIPKFEVPRPAELKDHLDNYVVGQERVKKILSVAVHNHYKRLQHIREGGVISSGVDIEKSNVLMIGPTGCGKTLLARTLAQKLEVPFAMTDATTLTEAGYVGEDVENILLRLIQAANEDIGKAQVGIIYVDEIDKTARRTENVSITRDVSGEGVQQALLKILEGNIANVPPKGGRKHPQQEYLRIDTTNILFICAGAFVGLEDSVRRRIGKRVLGFSGPAEQSEEERKMLEGAQVLEMAEPEDLLKFGLIPEFVGRLPVIAPLAELTEEDLVKVLTEPRNSLIKQYQTLFSIEGVELKFTDGALRALARLAKERGTGARGLRAILESLMVNVMYDVPSRQDVESCTITEAAVDGRESPRLKKKTAARQRRSA